MSRVVIALIALAACQPFYRDNLRAGRRAETSGAIDKQLDAAERAASTGDLRRAIELAREAIRANPERSRGYAILAINLRRAGKPALARTIVNYAHKEFSSSIDNEIAAAYADDDLIADAIDQSRVTDLKAALAMPAVATAVQELVDADAGAIDVGLGLYLHWLQTYGVPDQAYLRDARSRITKRCGEAIETRTPLGMRLGAIGSRASAANDLPGALALYALAFRVLPDDRFLAYRGAMARAAGKVTDPATTDPVAWGLAVDGDLAIKAGKLGAAIHAYRRAVAQAPWWRAAHGNLAELFTLAGRTDEAKLELQWVDGLAVNAGWAQERDSPPVTDLDGDGVVEPNDRCPYEPEDKDGFEDDDGCPERDNDRDGIADTKDRCPVVAEDRDGFEDDDGCPELDNDGDRIPDTADRCPLQPETYNGTLDTDGCPDEGRVVVEPTALRLLDPIDFQGKTAKLAATAPKILDAVVATLVGNPKLAIEIGGHGKVLGKPERDLVLTQSRAQAVASYLIAHGIDETRLVVVGYGDTKPMDPGVDAKALARNRRIELQIKQP